MVHYVSFSEVFRPFAIYGPLEWILLRSPKSGHKTAPEIRYVNARMHCIFGRAIARYYYFGQNHRRLSDYDLKNCSIDFKRFSSDQISAIVICKIVLMSGKNLEVPEIIARNFAYLCTEFHIFTPTTMY